MSRRAVVGRDSELDLLLRCLGQVAANGCRVALVEGEAGMGKTAVLQEAVEAARGLGFTVLCGAAHELTQDLPFAAIASALELRQQPGDRRRAAVAAALRAGSGRHLRLLDDVLNLVEAMAVSGPVLLAVDDLHWADGPSLAALDHVARHCGPLSVAILGTLRPASGPPDLARFLAGACGSDALHVRLGPLQQEAVAAVIAGVAGAQPGPALLRHADGAGGNPLYLRELTRALQGEGVLRVVNQGADPVVELTTTVLPLPFRRLVLRRLARLPEPAVELLRLASILGSTFAVGDLVEVTGRPASEVTEALLAAAHDGLLDESGDDLVFRHQLVRDAIYEDMARGVRGALHRQVGRALAAAGAPAVKVAAHLARGARPGDAEAVGWLGRAASELLARAPATSVELLDRALQLAGEEHPERPRLEAERGLALVWAGRAADGVQAAGALLARERGGQLEPLLRQTLAHAHVLLGRGADSAEQAEILAFDCGLDDRARALFMGDAALAHILSGGLARASALAAQSVNLAGRLQDPVGLSVGLSAQALVAYFEARLPAAVELARRADEQAVRARDPEAVVRPTRVWLGLCLADAERYEEAAAHLQRGRRHSERAGLFWHLALYHSAAGRLGWVAGQWDDAVAEMQTSIRLGGEVGLRWATPQQWSLLAHVALHRGDAAAASEALAMAESEFAACGAAFGMEVLVWARALVHEAHGEPDAAAAMLAAAWSAMTAAGYLTQCLWLGPDTVRLALAAGERDLAELACAGVEEAAARSGLASAAGVGLRCRGLLRDDPDLLTGAVEQLRQGRRRMELAAACEDAGLALARRRRLREGVALVEEAVEAYRQLGARADLDRATAALRRLGVPHRWAEPRRRPRVGWDALTGTERRVVDLAAQGLTNPEVGRRLGISRRTVETHLSHAFGKLGVSSRVELAAAHGRLAASTATPS